MSLDLNSQQRKIVAAGVTTLAFSVIVAAALVLMFLMVRFVTAFEHVFLPLAVAGVAALVVEPWYEWLRDRAHLPASAALAVTFLSIGVPLLGALVLFGTLIATQVGEIIDQLPQWFEQLRQWFDENWPMIAKVLDEHPVGVRVRDFLQQPGGPLTQVVQGMLDGLRSAGLGAASAVVAVFGWAIMPVYMAFFLLMPKPQVDQVSDTVMPFLREGTREDFAYLVRQFIGFVVSFFRGQLLIALIQGVLFAIGFTLVGLDYGIVLGLTLGFLNIIPYLGSILGLAVTLPLAWFQADGGLVLLLLVVAVFCVVQLIEGYFLTPKIMGDRTGLHPLAIIVAIFFWGSALDGILGMILAIPLTAFLVVAWQLARQKYIREIF